MSELILRAAYGDTLSVHHGEQRIGEVAPSCDGWAAYKAGPHGRMVIPRIGTYPSIKAAVEAVGVSSSLGGPGLRRQYGVT